MCSIESIGSSSISTSNNSSNKNPSLKILENRLKHLREQLKNFTQRALHTTTSNFYSEQTIDDNGEHDAQLKKCLNQLIRLHRKEVDAINHWYFYRSHAIERMHTYELRQSDERFRTNKNDLKSKLISMYHDKRRCLEVEYQNMNIRSFQISNYDRTVIDKATNLHEMILFDNQHHHLNEPVQQVPSQRPTYNLRRPVPNDLPSENSSSTITPTSLKDLSIFSRSNSVLPPFGGIELQCALSHNDIEQDVIDVQYGLSNDEVIMDIQSSNSQEDSSIVKPSIDVRIEDGRLWYQRAWFSRNSPILLVFDDLEIVPALVLTVGRNDLLIRRSGTNIKHRVSLSLLYDGHLAIRKRNCLV